MCVDAVTPEHHRSDAMNICVVSTMQCRCKPAMEDVYECVTNTSETQRQQNRESETVLFET